MRKCQLLRVILLCAALGASCLSHAADEGEPLLRLEAGGPTCYVTALSFSSDGRTLYAGSWDKTVRVWRWSAPDKEYRLDPVAWRIPIGPGLDGAINAIAVSADGNWLAAAGRPVIRGSADYRNPGRMLPTLGGMSDTMRQDEGTIYVFDTRTRVTRTLRGHRGEVRSLAFAPSGPEAPLLVSAAREWDEKTGKFGGSVRLWNAVAAEPYVTGRLLPEPRHETWPKLAVRRTGAGPQALQVGIAWGDGVFRVWDVARNRVAESPGQGQFQDTVVFQETDDQFMTGAVGGDGGTRLRSWKSSATGAPEVDAARSVELAKSGDVVAVPRALSLASSEPGGKADLLACVIHRHFVRESAKDQYELWLLKSPYRGAKIQASGLWSAGSPPRRLPVISAVPGGKHLAVTNGQEIHVYAIADLHAGGAQPQILRSAGASIGTVAFVQKDGALALGMSEKRPPSPGSQPEFAARDLLFDFDKGALADYAADAGWEVAAPPAGGWRVESQNVKGADGAAQRRLVIFQDAARRGSVDLPAGHEVTGYALATNREPPVLAVAVHHDGLPALGLYNAATGRQVRQLSGHAGLIRALAFSADAQLLASAADDQTVAIWRLADLDKIVGKRGQAQGVAVRESPEGLTVEVDETLAGETKLKDGDVLLGRVVGEQLRAWASPRDFYDTFWNLAPGETVELRRSRGGEEAAASVPVDQGVDERKPLLSLFVTRGPDAKGRGWIGWSPLGPYQASGVEVERHLGWHFNTGRPEAPASFAAAAQYREKYFRQGLIESLIKTGQPPEAPPDEARISRPELELIVDGADGKAGAAGEDGLVRQPPKSASLIVYDLAAANIEKVELQIDGETQGALELQADGKTWTAALELAAWKPGEHHLHATVHTRESEPQMFAAERRLRYQNPPPQVTIASAPAAAGVQAVDQPQLEFAAAVVPGGEGEVDVVLRRRAGKEEVEVKRWTTNKRLEIKESVTLDEGGNLLELVAINRDALKGFEKYETAQQQLTLNFSNAVQPGIVSVDLKPLQDGAPVRTVGMDGAPVVVTVDKIELSGEIRGAGGKLEAQSSLGGPGAPLNTLPAAAGKPAKFTTGEIPLKPGVQTLHLSRAKPGDPLIESGIRVEYRPPLPRLSVESPKSDQVLIEGRDQPLVELRAKLDAARHPHPFEAVILVNGKASPIAPVIDQEARTLTAKIPLAPGENKLAIRVSNAWNPASETSVAMVKFLRLPSVTKFSELKDVQSPLVDVTVFGKSAIPVLRVEAADVELQKKAIRYDQAKGEWEATIKDVPLKSEASELSVHVWNEHGKSLAPGTLKLPAWRQPEPPPVIELAAGGNVTQADYQLQFTARSKSRLRSVNIKQGKALLDYAPNLKDLKPDVDGWFEFKATVPVKLAPGNNRFEVLAANESGSQSEQSVINYIDPPARVVIDRLETVDTPAAQKLSVSTKDGRVQVDQPVPSAKVMLYGRIDWSRSADANYLKRLQHVQVWVNGFQQAPAIIAPPGKTYSSEFSAFVVLNQKEGNHIQFALPELTADISTIFDIYADCANPVREQRLHLLVIGVGTPPGSEAELEAQVLDAMKARKFGRELRTSAFDRLAIYGPLVGSDITPQQVRYQLSMIKVNIDKLYRANQTSVRPANDVVMIYLQGGGLAHLGEDFYITTRPPSDPRTARALAEREPRIFQDVAVRSRNLADFLTYTTGAHLLMLDVTGSPETDASALWPEQSRAAMLRYTWLKDSSAPPKARLLAALPEAIQNSGELKQVDARFASIHSRLAQEFPLSIAYRRRVPEILQNLLLGENLPP